LLVVITDFALAALAAFGLEASVRSRGRAGGLREGWRLVAYAMGAVLAVVVPLAYLASLLSQDIRDRAYPIVLIAVLLWPASWRACSADGAARQLPGLNSWRLARR
jgi:hypothetical protein